MLKVCLVLLIIASLDYLSYSEKMRYKPHYLNSILIASASGSTKWSHNVTQVKKPTKSEEEKDKRFVLKINNYPYVFDSNIVLYKSFVSAIIYFFVDYLF